MHTRLPHLQAAAVSHWHPHTTRPSTHPPAPAPSCQPRHPLACALPTGPSPCSASLRSQPSPGVHRCCTAPGSSSSSPLSSLSLSTPTSPSNPLPPLTITSHGKPGYLDLALAILDAARSQGPGAAASSNHSSTSASPGTQPKGPAAAITLRCSSPGSIGNAMRAATYAQTYLDPVSGRYSLAFTLMSTPPSTFAAAPAPPGVHDQPAAAAGSAQDRVATTAAAAGRGDGSLDEQPGASRREPGAAAVHLEQDFDEAVDFSFLKIPQLPLFNGQLASRINSQALPGSTLWVVGDKANMETIGKCCLLEDGYLCLEVAGQDAIAAAVRTMLRLSRVLALAGRTLLTLPELSKENHPWSSSRFMSFHLLACSKTAQGKLLMPRLPFDGAGDALTGALLPGGRSDAGTGTGTAGGDEGGGTAAEPQAQAGPTPPELRRCVVKAEACNPMRLAKELAKELRSKGQCLLLAEADIDIAMALEVLRQAQDILEASTSAPLQLMFKARCYPDMDDSPHFSHFPVFFAVALHCLCAPVPRVREHLSTLLPSSSSSTPGSSPLTISLLDTAPSEARSLPAAWQSDQSESAGGSSSSSGGRRGPGPQVGSALAAAAAAATQHRSRHEDLSAQLVQQLWGGGAAALRAESSLSATAAVRAMTVVTDSLGLMPHSAEAVAMLDVQQDDGGMPGGAGAGSGFALPSTTFMLLLAAGIDPALHKAQQHLLLTGSSQGDGQEGGPEGAAGMRRRPEGGVRAPGQQVVARAGARKAGAGRALRRRSGEAAGVEHQVYREEMGEERKVFLGWQLVDPLLLRVHAASGNA